MNKKTHRVFEHQQKLPPANSSANATPLGTRTFGTPPSVPTSYQTPKAPSDKHKLHKFRQPKFNQDPSDFTTQQQTTHQQPDHVNPRTVPNQPRDSQNKRAYGTEPNTNNLSCVPPRHLYLNSQPVLARTSELRDSPHTLMAALVSSGGLTTAQRAAEFICKEADLNLTSTLNPPRWANGWKNSTKAENHLIFTVTTRSLKPLVEALPIAIEKTCKIYPLLQKSPNWFFYVNDNRHTVSLNIVKPRLANPCTYSLKQFHTEEECYSRINDVGRYGKAATDAEARKRRQERLGEAAWINRTTDQNAPRPWKLLRQQGQQGDGYPKRTAQDEGKKLRKAELEKAGKEERVRGFQRAESPSYRNAGRRNV